MWTRKQSTGATTLDTSNVGLLYRYKQMDEITIDLVLSQGVNTSCKIYHNKSHCHTGQRVKTFIRSPEQLAAIGLKLFAYPGNLSEYLQSVNGKAVARLYKSNTPCTCCTFQVLCCHLKWRRYKIKWNLMTNKSILEFASIPSQVYQATFQE